MTPPTCPRCGERHWSTQPCEAKSVVAEFLIEAAKKIKPKDRKGKKAKR